MRPVPGKTVVRFRYAAAVVGAAAAVGVRVALDPALGNSLPFVFDYIAVLAVIRWLGAGPAIAAIAVCAAATPYEMPRPDWARLGLFVVSMAAVVWIVESFRRARAVSDLNARLAAEQLAETERQAGQLRQSERLSAQLRAIVESSEDAIISKDLNGAIQTWNRGAEKIYGYSEAEMLGRPLSILLPQDRRGEEDEILDRIRQGGRLKHFETVRLRKDGRAIRVSLSVSPIRDAAGELIGISHISRDITEQKQFEEQLRERQKLESLGVLAGGLAHDFNNLLTGIMGNASLAMEEAGNAAVVRERASEILETSERAAVLVRQMLAYAGKSRFVTERLDLSAAVRELAPLLRTSVSRLIRWRLELDPELPPIQADAKQIQQLIMNLAINAGEAIGEREGDIAIRTFARGAGAEADVVLQVQDTGAGMDEATKARIFDPFFTTKFTGRGLGLSAALGIIRQHRGSISVETAPGQGTTFTVILPAAAGQGAEAGELRGAGCILVADREELVRNMARFTLEDLGYTVETAADAKDALHRLTERPGHFAAVLLEMTEPGDGAGELLRMAREIRAGLPVIVTSTCPEEDAFRYARGAAPAGFLRKPYTATALARRIAEVLRSAAGSTGTV
jgi:PAS domain S-box-containing protein